MKFGLTAILLLITKIMCFAQEDNTPINLIGTIHSDLNQEKISFYATLEIKKKSYLLKIINGKEIIALGPEKLINDSLHFHFNNYNSSLVIAPTQHEYKGYWINHHDEKPIQRIVEFTPVTNFPTETKKAITGSWKIELTANQKTKTGIAVFESGERNIGTIRTETGDYGFLSAVNPEKEAYTFTSFDGNNAYALSLNKDENNQYIGKLFTAKSSAYTALKMYEDESFQLSDPLTMTKVVNTSNFQLALKDEKGNEFDYKKASKNKVSIITIFGTWCPNCIDETNFLKEIATNYSPKKLAIIHVAFENGKTEEIRREKVQRFKKAKNLSSTFIIAENPTKENVLTHFPMIDNFRSYPTLFVVNKKGEIESIYTGFNGPATGVVYQQFKAAFTQQLNELIKK